MAKDKPTFDYASWRVACELSGKYRDRGLDWDQSTRTWRLCGQPIELSSPDWMYFAPAIKARTDCRCRVSEPNSAWRKCQEPDGMEWIAENLKFLLAVGRTNIAALQQENDQLRGELAVANDNRQSLLGDLAKLLREQELMTL